MSSAQIEIQLIASLVAIACVIPGTFLVLRKMAMISDAISHSVLLGIVIGFFFTHSISSPILIILAAITGVVTVILVEFIEKTKLVKEDTAIGLVFPALFSIGVIMIAKNANDVHLDIDSVLVGEIAFAPFDRLTLFGLDLPKSLWVISTILIISIFLIIAYFKEIKVSTFDKQLAASMGFSPVLIHYGLMSLASVTTVGAFDAVGSILVVALMIGPAAVAYLITESLKKMIYIGMFVGVLSAISGYWLAHSLNTSIAGSITSVLAIVFLITYLLAPRKGLLAVIHRKSQQRIEISMLTLLLHLNNHKSNKQERHIEHLEDHINWQKIKAKKVLYLAIKNNMIYIENNIINLTKKGQTFTDKAIEYIINHKKTEIELMKSSFFLFRG